MLRCCYSRPFLGHFHDHPPGGEIFEVRLLLKAQADMEARDSRGLTALKVAEASESWTTPSLVWGPLHRFRDRSSVWTNRRGIYVNVNEMRVYT